MRGAFARWRACSQGRGCYPHGRRTWQPHRWRSRAGPEAQRVLVLPRARRNLAPASAEPLAGTF